MKIENEAKNKRLTVLVEGREITGEYVGGVTQKGLDGEQQHLTLINPWAIESRSISAWRYA